MRTFPDSPTRAPARSLVVVAALTVAVLVPPEGVGGQEVDRQNRANWAQLERFSEDNLERFIHSSTVSPNWINETDSLWYEWTDRRGTRFQLVLPDRGENRPLFDHERMAARLSEELGTYLEAGDLGLEEIEFQEDGRRFRFQVEETLFEYDLETSSLENLGEAEEEDEEREWRSWAPDSTAYVYAEEHDLYLVEIVEGEEGEPVRISHDGEEEYSFGHRDEDELEEEEKDDEEKDDEEREDEETRKRVDPDVTWSEDSQAFAVTRGDRRHVAELFLVDVLAEPRPELESYRYSMPGEEEVPQTELHVFLRDGHEFRELEVDRWPDQRLFDIHWTNGDSEHLRLVRRDRTQRRLELVELEVATGEERGVLEESVDRGHLRRLNVGYLGEDNSGDFLWYSRRTGWAHLYRYGHDGTPRGAVTSGSWNVVGIEEVDHDEGLLWFTAVGREEGENPYYRHLYRVTADGGQLTLLDPGDADHRSELSPSRRFVLNTRSRVDEPWRSMLRDQRGELVLELEEMDVSELREFGWQEPGTFVVRAADGVTDIYGNIWTPFDFDPDHSYPVIAHVYPGPQTESVRTAFAAATPQEELAQLGFVVIQIGNRGGSPLRSAAYHSYGYFNLRDYGLADKKAGIQELGKRHPWIDTERVGIYGHSGGGFMTAAALLVPPYNEFFRVGVSSAGNHDNNVYNQNWSEQHHGLEEEELCTDEEGRVVEGARDRPGRSADPAGGEEREGHGGAGQIGDGEGSAVTGRHDLEVGDPGDEGVTCETRFEIHVPANHEVAENLEGHLLLVHGDMDNNVHHAGTMRLVKELIEHEKRFDFMMFPGMRHGFGDYSPYFQRMLREYFAEHLLGDYYRASADMNDGG